MAGERKCLSLDIVCNASPGGYMGLCSTTLLLQYTYHKQQADKPHGADFNVGTLSKTQRQKILVCHGLKT